MSAQRNVSTAEWAYDLARYGEGRFVLGLGPQIRPHIQRRFSMPWSAPARRMRELVLALRAIWSAWQDGTPLRFEGEFYTHTLMTPNFRPPPHRYGPPPVYLAGVGPRMTEVAGEVADGFLTHSFASPRFLREVTLPALDRGAGDGRRPAVSGLVFAAVGRDAAELDAAVAAVRHRIGFYASTPAYRPVLELHGWGELQPRFAALVRAGRWDELAAQVPDEVLHELAVVGSPAEAGRVLAERYTGIVDRLALNLPYPHDAALRDQTCAVVRAALSDPESHR